MTRSSSTGRSEFAEFGVALECPSHSEVCRPSAEFRHSIERLIEAAKAKDVDATSLAYVDMTLKCVHCHKYVRSGAAGAAKESLDFWCLNPRSLRRWVLLTGRTRSDNTPHEAEPFLKVVRSSAVQVRLGKRTYRAGEAIAFWRLPRGP